MAHDTDLATPIIPGAVGDNYTNYVLDHFGYQYDVEELMTPAERRFKASLTTLAPHAIQEQLQHNASTNPLEWLMLAHAALHGDLINDAIELLERILAHTPYHTAIAHDEVCGKLIGLLLQLPDQERARGALKKGVELLGEAWAERTWWEGALCWTEGDTESAVTHWTGWITGEHVDAERAYEVAAWLMSEGSRREGAYKETADDFLERSASAAREQGLRAVLVDIELLRTGWTG